jgi:hypothetical protein
MNGRNFPRNPPRDALWTTGISEKLEPEREISANATGVAIIAV